MKQAARAFLALGLLLAGEARAAVFSITLDIGSVNFGLVAPGASSELGAGGHHHEVTVVSEGAFSDRIPTREPPPVNSDPPRAAPPLPGERGAQNGVVAYYVKIYDTSPLTSEAFSIPNSHFEWLASYSDGQGVLAAGGYQAFRTSPALVYSARGTDLIGTAVHIRFRYRLTVPGAQGAGTYTTTVVYLLTETL